MSTVILLGVKQRTIIHASYVNDFLAEFQPESVFLQVPPDLPLFIKSSATQADFKARWFGFLRHNKDARFYVKTRPQYTSDIRLNNTDRPKKLVNENLVPAIDDYELGVKSVYSRHKGSTLERTLRPDALLTPLLYGYSNSMNKNIQYYMGDMPNLVWRE